MSEEKKCNCGCEEGNSCGCGEHDHDHESLFVDLEDENGNVVSCEIVDNFQYEENEYVLVQNPEDHAVYLFKVVGDEENSELVVPEDDEFDRVSAYYQTLANSEE